jgi:hypothetical protein
MDSILTIILIWVVISLLNYFSKRSKKSEKPKTISPAPPPVKEKNEIPPFLREIFNIPETHLPTAPPLPSEEISDSKESEYSIEREPVKEFKKRKFLEEQAYTPTEPERLGEQIAQSPIISDETAVQWEVLPVDSLKAAVIWKEILDKPLSMRSFRYRRRD